MAEQPKRRARLRANTSGVVDLAWATPHHVRSAKGAKFYGLPIGSVIVADPHLKVKTKGGAAVSVSGKAVVAHTGKKVKSATPLKKSEQSAADAAAHSIKSKIRTAHLKKGGVGGGSVKPKAAAPKPKPGESFTTPDGFEVKPSPSDAGPGPAYFIYDSKHTPAGFLLAEHGPDTKVDENTKWFPYQAGNVKPMVSDPMPLDAAVAAVTSNHKPAVSIPNTPTKKVTKKAPVKKAAPPTAKKASKPWKFELSQGYSMDATSVNGVKKVYSPDGKHIGTVGSVGVGKWQAVKVSGQSAAPDYLPGVESNSTAAAMKIIEAHAPKSKPASSGVPSPPDPSKTPKPKPSGVKPRPEVAKIEVAIRKWSKENDKPGDHLANTDDAIAAPGTDITGAKHKAHVQKLLSKNLRDKGWPRDDADRVAAWRFGRYGMATARAEHLPDAIAMPSANFPSAPPRALYGAEVHQPPHGSTVVMPGSPEYDQALIEAAMRNMIAQWAISSNDTDPTSLGMQVVAQDLFGLGGHEVAPWSMNPGLRDDVEKVTGPKYRPFIEAFLNAQYEETQKELKSRGVKSVRAVRGFNFTLEKPEWSTALNNGQEAHVVMRPMSSWSTNTGTAKAFAGAGAAHQIIEADIPAEKILSFPSTGFGCLNEFEVVVIGGNTHHRGASASGHPTWPDGKPMSAAHAALMEGSATDILNATNMTLIQLMNALDGHSVGSLTAAQKQLRSRVIAEMKRRGLL